MTPETIIAKMIHVLRDQFARNFMAQVIADKFAAKDPDAAEIATALCTQFDTDDALVDFLTRIFNRLAKAQAAPAEPT